MLGKFSTALQNAVDVLAPPPPPHEDFAYHWKKLMKHYLDVTAEKNVPVESTNIPARLDQLLKILIKEDEELFESGHPGPCMEYLLQHNLLNLLATLAGSDDPSGLRQTVLQFIAKFLTNIKTPVLGHTSVFPPLQRIVAQCEKTNGPNDIHEVQFLLRLTAMVRRNPQLVPVFTTPTQEQVSLSQERRDSCSSDGTSCISSAISDCSSTPQNNPLFAPLATSVRSKSVRLLPVETLSASTSSSDDKSLVVDEPAQFPLLDAVIPFLFSENCSVKLKACQTVMLLCSLPEDKAAEIIISDTLLLSRLSTHLADLFHDIPDTTEPSTVDELHVSWGLEAEQCETGLKQLTSFLSWFDFCDQLISESHTIIASALANEIKLKFLIELFTPDILKQPLSVTVLTKCYKITSSNYLNNVFGSWLIEGSTTEADKNNEKFYSVKNTLFSNWNSRNAELALESLRFFETVLEKGDLIVLNNFIFEYVRGQPYLDKTMPDEVLNKNNETGTRIESIVNSFIDIIPNELRSSDCNLYEQYIAESQRQYKSVLEGKCLEEEILDNRLDIKFFEGPFLNAMFEAISNMPYQPYEINLELTGIVSKICLRAEKDLSKYLLESAICRFVPEAKSLYKILLQTASLLISSISSVPNYLNVLKITRAKLISDDLTTTQNDEFWSSSFENLVVLEELSKELAAIAFVKYKHSANQLLTS